LLLPAFKSILVSHIGPCPLYSRLLGLEGVMIFNLVWVGKSYSLAQKLGRYQITNKTYFIA